MSTPNAIRLTRECGINYHGTTTHKAWLRYLLPVPPSGGLVDTRWGDAIATSFDGGGQPPCAPPPPCPSSGGGSGPDGGAQTMVVALYDGGGTHAYGSGQCTPGGTTGIVSPGTTCITIEHYLLIEEYKGGVLVRREIHFVGTSQMCFTNVT